MADDEFDENEHPGFGEEDEYHFDDSDDEFSFGHEEDSFDFPQDPLDAPVEESSEFGFEQEDHEQSESFADLGEQEAPQKKSMTPLIVGALIILLVVFGVYEFFGKFSSRPTPTSATNANLATPTSTTPQKTSTQQTQQASTTGTQQSSGQQQQPVQLPAQQQTTPSATTALAQQTSAVSQHVQQTEHNLQLAKGRIDTLEQQDATLAAELKTMQQMDLKSAQQIQQLQANIQNIQNQINNMNKGLRAFVSDFRTLQSEFKERLTSLNQVPGVPQQLGMGPSSFNSGSSSASTSMPSKSSAPSKSSTGSSLANMRYFVTAIIPGRAWLQSSNGQTVTVVAGDTLPGYGTITEIDPQKGIVQTSVGITLQYGIEEG